MPNENGVIRFSPTQKILLRVLADGQPHTDRELEETAKLKPNTSLKVHLAGIRKTIRSNNEDILRVFFKRKRGYQQIISLNPTVGGESHWLYKEFQWLVRDRDGGICQECGNEGERVFNVRKWVHYPELRLEPSNGILLCGRCFDARSRVAGKNGRPIGAVDDPTKR